ncbi:hypothetical protein Taro_036015 [Colocasia esculenta]|uniref:Uncharacterized protein n=1 Tax=Colocasia esculenta TaxID=4460 RepID=A0A843WKE2_COLES|nr:hypothetical protein [Colocasia esculenta]
MTRFLEGMAQFVAQHRDAPVPQGGTGKVLREFLQFQPQFLGQPDPDAARAWLDAVERTFRSMECVPEERVLLASYQLQLQALTCGPPCAQDPRWATPRWTRLHAGPAYTRGPPAHDHPCRATRVRGPPVCGTRAGRPAHWSGGPGQRVGPATRSGGHGCPCRHPRQTFHLRRAISPRPYNYRGRGMKKRGCLALKNSLAIGARRTCEQTEASRGAQVSLLQTPGEQERERSKERAQLLSRRIRGVVFRSSGAEESERESLLLGPAPLFIGALASGLARVDGSARVLPGGARLPGLPNHQGRQTTRVGPAHWLGPPDRSLARRGWHPRMGSAGVRVGRVGVYSRTLVAFRAVLLPGACLDPGLTMSRSTRHRGESSRASHAPKDTNFVPAGWDGPVELLATERVQLEQAVLADRDSMIETCGFHYPSFPLGYTAQAHFPDASQLGLFGLKPFNPVGEARLAQDLWEVYGQPKIGPSFAGRVLLPSGSQFAPEGYNRLCFLDRILSGEAASWYDRWSVISSHSFRFGATELWMGVLHHYRELLDQVGIFHAVAAALHDYPCHSGLLQALAVSRDPTDYTQLSVDLEDGASTFVLPFGEEGLIRPELIYPVCLLHSCQGVKATKA